MYIRSRRCQRTALAVSHTRWRVTIASNGAGGWVGFGIDAHGAGPLMRFVPAFSGLKDMADDDTVIAKRSLDMQSRARDVPLVQIPAYIPWSRRKLTEGASAALIAHLDSTAMWLLPEDIATIGDVEFDEMLTDLQKQMDSD
jgi:hypothetical protein